MKRVIHTVLTATALVGSSAALTPQAAFAYPTCEQEIRIRCMGHSVGNHGRLDIYYDSFEECYEAETFAQCPNSPPPSGWTFSVVDRRESAGLPA